MHQQKLKELLQLLNENHISLEEAFHKIKNLPYEDMGFAKIDHHRHLRQGFPEVIYCPGKKKMQIVEIFRRLIASGAPVLATRANAEIFAEIKREFSETEYHEESQAIVWRGENPSPLTGKVAVVSAGTADAPVAGEAAITAELMGAHVEKICDVGVAGIHRLMDHRENIQSARAIVVVAGMEGALASVVGGLVDRPVIAVPTSVGYGAHLNGLAPLLTMLNSCATGVSVVNIDNGFGAGYTAALINRIGDLSR